MVGHGVRERRNSSPVFQDLALGSAVTSYPLQHIIVHRHLAQASLLDGIDSASPEAAGTPRGGDRLEGTMTGDILGDPPAVDVGFRAIGSVLLRG